MRSKRFVIATLAVDGSDVRLKYGDLVVVVHDGATTLDWEFVVMPFDPTPLEPGAYRLTVVTIEGRELTGDTILVRSVSGTHVLRGAGDLVGLHHDELEA